MIPKEYVWIDGKSVPWNDATVHFLTHGLHYGSAVYEGIRIYPTTKGPAIFRLNDHLERFFNSAALFGMRLPYSKEALKKATISLAKNNHMKEGYIRPLAFYGEGYMGFDVRKAKVCVGIGMWSWEKYAAKGSLDVCISPFERLTKKNTKTEAKIAGHYAMSIMALQDALKKGYDSCILLDDGGFVAEGPTENIFIVKRSVLMTPKKGNILLGVTRDCILKLAKDLGIKAIEKDVSVDELKNADEVFFTGTGSELLAIGTIDGKIIGKGRKGPVTAALEQAYQSAISGDNKKYQKWLTYFS